MHPIAELSPDRQPETMSTSSWDRISSDGAPDSDADVPNPNPIAICGMAMRLPGGISSEDKLWEFLINKENARVKLPLERYNSEAFHGRTTYGYFLHDDIKKFDASMFKMTKAELDVLDPQARLLLELTRECFENSGEIGWRGKNIGVYIGTWSDTDFKEIQTKDPEHGDLAYSVTGIMDFQYSNKISHEYDLHGPSITLKSACSSGLAAIHDAFRAIRAGDIRSALVGGTNLLLSPTQTDLMYKAGVLSPNDQCRSFDADGDGYCRAEAVNMLYIKRLDDALRDGNPVRAIIRGTFSNADGEGEGLFAPNAIAHEALIRSCYQTAGITDLGQTAHFECHGTGTPVGDPIETSAVAKVFEEHGGITIGSVKPNLGHSEGASGITSVIKSILALENRTIPPNIKFDRPNPNIPWDRGLRVPLEPTPFPDDRAERISINAFGLGGSNAHVILDSVRSFGLHPGRYTDRSPGNAAVAVSTQAARKELLVYTANRSESISIGMDRLGDFITNNPAVLDDTAYTLAVHREHLPWRTFAVSNGIDRPEFHSPVKASSTKHRSEVVFVFTGQGAQWATMGSGLLREFASAREDVAFMDATLSDLGRDLAPNWTIKDELAKLKDESRVGQAEFSQPLATAVQLMVVNILRDWGIHPVAVVGHSSGEIAAAYASNALTMREAIICAYIRGWATTKQDRIGAMAAVGLGRDSVQHLLSEGKVVIACENSPSSVTISGDSDEVDRTIEAIKASADDVFVRRLHVDKAYHSHHMKEPGALLERTLSAIIDSKAPAVPFYSTVSQDVLSTEGSLGASYWRSNMQSPVLFNSVLTKLLQDRAPASNTILLEIGPHSTLAGPIRQILKLSQATSCYIPTLTRDSNEREALLFAAGKLFSYGARVRFEALGPKGRVQPLVPRYPWYRDATYWYESRLSSEWRNRRFPRHELLGTRVHQCGELEPVWRNVLRLSNIPWCRDHVIARDIVLPASAFLVMICEAVRQLTGAEDYSLRNMNISSPLILDDSAATEILLSLRPQKVTNSLNSSWYEVTISSFNGSAWIQHCTSQVRGGTEDEQKMSSKNIVDLPRKVDMAAVYEAVKGCGLKYGPTFRRLGRTSSYPGRPKIVRRLTTDVPGVTQPEHPDHYHPVTIDLCFQLLQLAVMDSLARNAKNMTMPSFVGAMYLKRPTLDGKLAVELEGKVTHTGGVVANSVAVAGNGEVVLRLEGCRMASLDDNGDNAGIEDPHAAARLLWQPDIGFQNIETLISSNYKQSRPPHPELQRFTLLACIDAQKRLERLGATLKVEHLAKFHSWLDNQVNMAQSEGYGFVEDVISLVQAPEHERASLLDEVTNTLRATSASTAVTAARRLLDSIEPIYLGEVSPLDLLRQDETWTNLYKKDDKWDYSPFLRLLGHRKPHLRVLEIGAGTGGTTDLILKGLHSDRGDRMFHSYVFTDISAGFFGAAKERFASVQGMVYMPLDITRDPEQQGFALASFDLIVVANVLHATPCLSHTLQNVRKLLRPDGRLLMEEMWANNKILNFIMGFLPGWWLGSDDDRAQEPYISPERWIRELSEAGFSGADAVILDAEEPFQIDVTIVASPRVHQDLPTAPVVSLLSRQPHGPIAHAFSESLKKRGLCVDVVGVTDEPRHRVLSILDLEGPAFLSNISDESFKDLRRFVLKSSETGGILWLTKPCQIESPDPAYAEILGLTRVLRNELRIKIATLELDEFVSKEAIDAIYHVLQTCLEPVDPLKNDVDLDSEYAWSRGALLIPRFYWISVAEELATSNKSLKSGGIKKLDTAKPGSLQSLMWVTTPEVSPGAGEISVEVRAVGMNFKASQDILIAMGVVGGNEDGASALGVECSGVVKEIGPGVVDFQVGDRIAAAATGSYSTTLIAKAHACVKMPHSLSFEEAATMPSVFGTVLYGLLELARLEAGQSVLIHSACGGIGIAAIQTCRAIGAEVYATVGSDEKVKYLIENFNIPRERIFSSRTPKFLQDVLRETGGRGVDVVLNSLSGELLHASWRCVAEFGCMIELGKRDFIGQGRLDMDAFEENRSFFGVHMIPIINHRPKIMRRVLDKLMDFYRQGTLEPIRPMQVFDATSIEEAFRFMQQGKHIGKLVVRMPQDSSLLRTGAMKQPLAVRPNASYLLVGGLGGLGRALSTWLAERGAKNLIYLSPNAGKGPQDAILVEELKALGCTAQLVPGSVAELSDVQRAVKLARLPIAGVVQMSMVLRDSTVENVTHEDWQAVTKPKVQGTWNLHTALANENMDFFILFSSLAGLVGQNGQANYACANTFLDAFVQFRHRQGLPAFAIDLGPVLQVGYVAGNEKVQNQLRAFSFHGLREQDVLDSLELAISKSCSSLGGRISASSGSAYTSEGQLAMGLRTTQPLHAVHNNVTWKRDPRMSLYRNIERAEGSTETSGGLSLASSGDGGVKAFLTAIESDPHILTLDSKVSELALHIRSALSSFMIRPAEEMEIGGSLSDLGVDSLVAIELRNWFRRAMALDVSVLEITQAKTLKDLAGFAAQGLQVKLGGFVEKDEGTALEK